MSDFCQETGLHQKDSYHSLCEGASPNKNTEQCKYRTIYITGTANKAKRTKYKTIVNHKKLNMTKTGYSAHRNFGALRDTSYIIQCSKAYLANKQFENIIDVHSAKYEHTQHTIIGTNTSISISTTQPG